MMAKHQFRRAMLAADNSCLQNAVISILKKIWYNSYPFCVKGMGVIYQVFYQIFHRKFRLTFFNTACALSRKRRISRMYATQVSFIISACETSQVVQCLSYSPFMYILLIIPPSFSMRSGGSVVENMLDYQAGII